MMIDGRFDPHFAEIFTSSLLSDAQGQKPGDALAVLGAAALGFAVVFCMLAFQ